MFEREGENSPDYGGFIDVDPDDVGELVEYLKTSRTRDRDGKTVIRFDVTSSKKTGQRGEFLTVAISEAYRKPRTQQVMQAASGEENQDIPF